MSKTEEEKSKYRGATNWIVEKKIIATRLTTHELAKVLAAYHKQQMERAENQAPTEQPDSDYSKGYARGFMRAINLIKGE